MQRSFGERLRARRELVSISRMAMAQALGVHVGTVARWEQRDTAPPDARRLFGLGELLGVTIEWLITGEDQSARSHTTEGVRS